MEISMNFEVRENYCESVSTSNQTPKSTKSDFKNVISKNKQNAKLDNKGVKGEVKADGNVDVNVEADATTDACEGNGAIEQDLLTAVRRALSKQTSVSTDKEQPLLSDTQETDEVTLEDLTEKIVDILEGFGLLNEQKGEIKLDKETLDYIFSEISKDEQISNEKTNNLVFGELAGTQKVSPNETNQELKELVLQYLSSLENSNDEVKVNDGQAKSITYQDKQIDFGKLNAMVQKAVGQAASAQGGQTKSDDMDLNSNQAQNIDFTAGVKQDSNQVQKNNASFSENLNAQANVTYEDIADNVTKIVSRMSTHVVEGKSEFDVELKPEFLGKVSIKLISENGEMKALIKAGNNEARNMIVDQLSMLNDALKDKGLNVSTIDVVYDSASLDMSNQNFLNQQNEQNNRKGSGNRRARQNNIESLSYDIMPEVDTPEISVRNSSVEFSA